MVAVIAAFFVIKAVVPSSSSQWRVYPD
jgi:hypothetical protein